MKKNLLITFFASMQLFSSAQGQIGYTYDDAGNRIERKIILAAPKVMAKKRSDTPSDFYSNMQSDHSVRIYPNPTKGQLCVEIVNYSDKNRYEMEVYSIAGELVFQEKNAGVTTDINLSNRSTGIYLLKIMQNGESKTWEIIKK